MASEKKDYDEAPKDQNVFFRILNLQSVSAALESVERTYTCTKQSHPMINSVCGLYEKGVSKTASFAVWSMQPALHVLEPKLVAANSMACKGLDRLEEKVPALQYPPEELAASIKEVVFSAVETAKDGIFSPLKYTSNSVLSMASSGYQQSKNALSVSMQYVINSKPVCLAEQRAGMALTLTESLVDYILPASSEETEDDGRVGEPEPDFGTSVSKPSLSRLGALAGTVYRRAFEKIAAQHQHTKSQGQELVTCIPGVTPLVDFKKRSMKTVAGLVLRFPSSLAAFLKDGQQHSIQMEITNDDLEQLKSYGVQSLVTIVANVKKAPQTSFNLAKNGIGIIVRSFGTAWERALHNFPYYGLLSRQSSKPEGGFESIEKDGVEKCLCGSLTLKSIGADHLHNSTNYSEKQALKAREPKEISEETRLMKKKVLKQIPMQQKVVLGGRSKNIPSHSPFKKGQSDHIQISSSPYTRTVQNTRNTAPTAE
ncbi:perilipin-1 isoform X1 [Xyrauchen texanus]|uniref:perilipin-1 isoform X1 n=1 Tax=Xyrauchen texanus TaxID=154827 RepID=UPI00224238E9|nr:perilipin-1 isoform X1 [Xyrauchen texanus]